MAVAVPGAQQPPVDGALRGAVRSRVCGGAAARPAGAVALPMPRARPVVRARARDVARRPAVPAGAVARAVTVGPLDADAVAAARALAGGRARAVGGGVARWVTGGAARAGRAQALAVVAGGPPAGHAALVPGAGGRTRGAGPPIAALIAQLPGPVTGVARARTVARASGCVARAVPASREGGASGALPLAGGAKRALDAGAAGSGPGGVPLAEPQARAHAAVRAPRAGQRAGGPHPPELVDLAPLPLPLAHRHRAAVAGRQHRIARGVPTPVAHAALVRRARPAVTSLDGDNGDWGRKMPKKRKILEDKKEDLDL